MTEKQHSHIPVMMQEVLTYLPHKKGGVYVDGTLGGGGHTTALLEQDPTCMVIGCDWDRTVLDTTGVRLQEKYPKRFIPLWTNFAKLPLALQKHSITKVDGILVDFGTSQMQIHGSDGFSVYHDTPLDMRMSPAHQQTTAYDIVKKSNADTLADIFFQYGGERYARRIARAIVEQRQKIRIKTTLQLADIVKKAVPFSKKERIHPATRVFQALRIVVNKELENIMSLLKNSLQILAPDARLVCISFHSLEDRLVKNFFKDKQREHVIDILTPKACMPTEQEVADNPASRSAKLRCMKMKNKC